MAPPFLPGDDNDWENVAKEITTGTTALKNIQDGKVTSPPEDVDLPVRFGPLCSCSFRCRTPHPNTRSICVYPVSCCSPHAFTLEL